MLFRDRTDAGRQLAYKLMSYTHENPFVIALPRGGVIVALEVAKALKAPLDVLVVRKLGTAVQPELGIGAIAPYGVRVLNTDLIHLMDIPEWHIEKITGMETAEMNRRLQVYRGNKPMPDLTNRTVILVDDGLATGISAQAAINALRKTHPKKIVLAVPVSSPETADSLRPEVDDLVYVAAPDEFMSVGSWYHRFDQTSDEEVIKALSQAKQWISH